MPYNETRLCVLMFYAVLAAVLVVIYAAVPESDHKDLTILNLQDAKEVYSGCWKFPGSSGSAALDICLQTCAIFTILVFIIGELTGNLSQVDKLWSVLPVLYVWEVALLANSGRLLLMSAVISVWGIRLTYNFGRRGGYSWPPWRGEEDYRWAYVRKMPFVNSRLGCSVFNLFFISIYQNILLMLMAGPALVASMFPRALSVYDWMVAASVLLLIAIETVADNQQLIFQTQKWRTINAGEKLIHPFSVGFPTHQLFSLSRHPNYAAEMSVWFVFYLFTITAGASLVNWSLAGAVLLCLLFQGSTHLSESITSKKYKEYKRYQASVDRFVGAWNPFQADFPCAIKD